MALSSHTLTGRITDLPGVPYRPGRCAAWIVSSSTVVEDPDGPVHVGDTTRLVLSGEDGAFSVTLPDSSEAVVLYRLWATWITDRGRPSGDRLLGSFELTTDADIVDVLETEDGELPASTTAVLTGRLDGLDVRVTDLEETGLPGGGAVGAQITALTTRINALEAAALTPVPGEPGFYYLPTEEGD